MLLRIGVNRQLRLAHAGLDATWAVLLKEVLPRPTAYLISTSMPKSSAYVFAWDICIKRGSHVLAIVIFCQITPLSNGGCQIVKF